jgi:uncharacterized protein (DUF1778 family)
VSDFVLRTALARADEILADRRVFKLDDEQSEAFMAALDAPPKPRPRLKRLLNEPPGLRMGEGAAQPKIVKLDSWPG